MKHWPWSGLLRSAAVAVALLLPLRTTPAEPNGRFAMRAVTLAPHITELIFAAGAGNKIVASVSSSQYPPAAEAIPKIGDGININVEKILSLQPDVIVAWQASGAAQILAPFLSALGAQQLYSEPKSLRDIPMEIIRFGVLFGTQTTAHETATRLQQQLKVLEYQYSTRTPVAVFLEVGAAPLYSIGSDPLLNDALRVCGGVNIYGQSAVAAPQVSVEDVLTKQPQAIITTETLASNLEARIQYWTKLHLAAAASGHVYAINADALFRPGPRLIEATAQLCRLLDEVRR